MGSCISGAQGFFDLDFNGYFMWMLPHGYLLKIASMASENLLQKEAKEGAAREMLKFFAIAILMARF